MLFAQNLSCQATLAPRLRVAETELQIQLSYYLVPKTKHLLIEVVGSTMRHGMKHKR